MSASGKENYSLPIYKLGFFDDKQQKTHTADPSKSDLTRKIMRGSETEKGC